MKYKIFAICDPEKEYAEKFSEYVREHGNIPMDIHVFTQTTELKAFMNTQRIEILLLSERLLSDDVREWPAGTVIILKEQGEKKETDRFPEVYKYRSVREILREVMDFYGQGDSIPAGERILKPACNVIGVYSPVARCFKTSFALTLGQILAGRKPTLYITLEEFSGLDKLLHEQFESNISDLIYLMRQGERDLISKMAAFVGHIASLDFIPPCTAGQELKGVSPEEWHELFREIIDHSSYEAVILDIGSGLNHLDDFLTECDVIYMPVANDIYADAKLASFETFLRLSGSERIAGRIRQIRLGEMELPGNRDRYLQQIVWSGIGDHARDCIIRDGL